MFMVVDDSDIDGTQFLNILVGKLTVHEKAYVCNFRIFAGWDTSWFSERAVRREKYKTLFLAMTGEDYLPSLPFQRTNSTWWLVRGKISQNWEVLSL